MTRAAIFAALVLLTACAPITRERELVGANATNRWPGIITLDPDAPDRAAIWAQEAYEVQRKLNPAGLALVRLDTSQRRDMELTSHEIETQAAVRLYGRDEAAYRAKEARSLHGGYDGIFAGMTPAQLEAAMRDRTPEARAWVDRHIKRIEAQK